MRSCDCACCQSCCCTGMMRVHPPTHSCTTVTRAIVIAASVIPFSASSVPRRVVREGMRCSMRALLLCLVVVVACSLPLVSGWKPRSLPRTAAAAGAPRHRFFLPNPCVLNDERTGAHYDLTSLRKTGSDYSGSDGDYFYKMNVCGPSNAGGPCGNALVCQYNAKTTNFVAKIAVYDGYFGPRLTLLDGNNPGAGVQAHYLNGDVCFLGPTKKRNPRTTIIKYVCASHTSDTFDIHEDRDTCTFTITLQTSAACWPAGSAGGGISNGTTFLILFFLFVSLYLGAGIMYNRQQGKEGRDTIPNLEFWSVTLPALVWDGVAFSTAKFNEFKEAKLKNGAGGLLGGGGEVDPDDPFQGKGAPTARTDDL